MTKEDGGDTPPRGATRRLKPAAVRRRLRDARWRVQEDAVDPAKGWPDPATRAVRDGAAGGGRVDADRRPTSKGATEERKAAAASGGGRAWMGAGGTRP
jgi:hypothetical protein